MGLPISRKEIANWHIKSSQYYFEPLYELLHEKLLTQDLLHADETAYRVLENETPLTYYWTFKNFSANMMAMFTVICGQRIANYLKQS